MLRIVLVRTRGPRNAGLAARAVANFAPAELLFVRPERSDLLSHSDYMEMSHGAGAAALRHRQVGSLEEALSDCVHSVGFTARRREHRPLEEWGAIRGELRGRCGGDEDRTALVFGNERDGLSGAECDLLHCLVRIPASEEHPSINLGACVTLVLAEMFGHGGIPGRGRKGRPLQGRDRAFLTRHAQQVLCGLIRGEAARGDLFESIERLFSRAELETRDARAWHRLLRQLGGDQDPGDHGL